MRRYPTTEELAESTAELFRCTSYYARKAPDDLAIGRDVAAQAWDHYADLMTVTEVFEFFNAYPPEDVGRALDMVTLAGEVLWQHAPDECGLEPFPSLEISGFDPDQTERLP